MSGVTFGHALVMALSLLDIPAAQEDEGEEDTDFTPMSQEGGSRRTFSIDSILPHRAVDPRPLRVSRLGTTPSGRFRDRSSKLTTCPTWNFMLIMRNQY